MNTTTHNCDWIPDVKAQSPDGWQPIETVPEDLYVDVWITVTNSSGGGRRITDVCKTKLHSKGWVGMEGYFIEYITHWMPLPQPPKEIK